MHFYASSFPSSSLQLLRGQIPGIMPQGPPSQLGEWAKALISMLDSFYSGCRDSSLLVDPHGALNIPVPGGRCDLDPAQSIHSRAGSSLGTHLGTSWPWLAHGAIRPSGTLGGGKREAKIRTQRIWLTGKSSCHFSLGHQDSP